MDKCKHCGKELTHVEGRKKKAFCDVNCRNKFFYAKNKKLVQDAKKTLSNPAAAVIVEPNSTTGDEFMGVRVPEGLAGIQLAVWKNNIKLGKKKK